jgi:hypothetical protein
MTDTNKGKTLDDLRAALFATLEGVRSGSIDLEKAKAVNEIGKTLIDTAKVEVDYLRVTGGGESSFLETAIGASNLPTGITGVTQHRLK